MPPDPLAMGMDGSDGAGAKKTQYLPRRLPAAPAPGQMRKRSRALAFIRGPPCDTITRPWFRIYTTGPQTRLTHTPATQTPVGWLRGPVSWLVLSPTTK